MNMFLDGETTSETVGGSPVPVKNDANKSVASDYDCVETVSCLGISHSQRNMFIFQPSKRGLIH